MKPGKILMLDSGAMNLAGLLEEEDARVEKFVFHPDAREQKPVGWGQMIRLLRKIRKGEFRSALFGESSHAWWRPGRGLLDGSLRMAMDLLLRPERCVQKIVPWVLARHGVPFLVVDRNDRPKIDSSCFLLYGLSSLYFMRELPPRRLDLFPNEQEVTGKIPLLPRQLRIRREVSVSADKLRPISLGIPDRFFEACSAERPAKVCDVFWAGKWNTNEARRRWVEELRASAPAGWKIEILEERIPHAEYLARMRMARLVLSPPGRGWDCYRHYEIAACGSVPLMTYPTIERDHPLEDGEHAFYFGTEPGGLARCLQRLARFQPDLGMVGRAAQSHVRQHHRWSVQSGRIRRELEKLCFRST